MIGAINIKLTDKELAEIKSSYRALLADAAKSGLTLKHEETREAWGYFKQLCAESFMRGQARRYGHQFN